MRLNVTKVPWIEVFGLDWAGDMIWSKLWPARRETQRPHQERTKPRMDGDRVERGTSDTVQESVNIVGWPVGGNIVAWDVIMHWCLLLQSAAVLQPHGDPLKTNLCLANGRYIPGLNIQQQHIRFYATCVGGYWARKDERIVCHRDINDQESDWV